MTGDGRRFVWGDSDLERLLQGSDDVVIDPPEVTCTKIGHAWHEVAHDSDTTPAYSRTCRRCGRAEVSAPGQPWQCAGEHDWREAVFEGGDEPLYLERCERCGAERIP